MNYCKGCKYAGLDGMDCYSCSAGSNYVPDELESYKKENAELDCQMNRNKFCYSCVNATDRCFRNEVGCPCEKYKSYKGLKKRLIKAKNLLTRFIMGSVYFNGKETDLVEEAEQFISEE